ncbi:bifunctional cytidylyltransferase/SDR family oxidoreductase [Moraxella oblonga]|uniref:bifunctional cytidylyltransferase/SDR family oxidoreductase n=1 Tax=Moraxella oblonga TaxID=200413 RepID=UPI00082F3964|nr:bifunctional cytidylyltransferase/SDR family oxidoreductase [Moraxella oblonga]
MSKQIAVILAGGVGSRMGLNYPKQFSKIAGATVFEHTVRIFQKHEQIDEIIVVAERQSYHKLENLVAKNHFSKVSKIVFGGTERTDSTLSALKALEDESPDTKLIIHDAVRPLLATHIISDCIAKLDSYNAVDVAIPATDTIVHVDTHTQEIINIPKRAEYYQGQTPQAFRLGTLRQAYDVYLQGEVQGTCDCGIVLKTLPDEKIAIVQGSETNIKLTRPVDLFIADKLFQGRSHFSLRNTPSLQHLTHLDGYVMVIIGGSYGIGKDIIDIANKINIKTYNLSRSNGVNVADIEALRFAFEQIYQEAGRIDFVVNSAAILTHKALALMTYEEVMESINVNYVGMVNSAIVAYPYLRETKGSFLSFTSSSYTRGRPFYSLYSSTKSAIVNFTQALSEEWLPDGIQINCINPERTKTPMRTRAFGIEPDGTLLNSKTVALASILTLISGETGNVVDVTLQDESYVHGLFDELGLND